MLFLGSCAGMGETCCPRKKPSPEHLTRLPPYSIRKTMLKVVGYLLVLLVVTIGMSLIVMSAESPGADRKVQAEGITRANIQEDIVFRYLHLSPPLIPSPQKGRHIARLAGTSVCTPAPMRTSCGNVMLLILTGTLLRTRTRRA